MLYKFWIQLIDGQTIEWNSLSLRQAKAMNKQTETSVDWTLINSFGWEELK